MTMTDPGRAAKPVGFWLSPEENYGGINQVVALAKACTVPGYVPAVLLPTAYGGYLQGEMERPRYRLIADELAPNTFEGLAEVRKAIESQGVRCLGWSVPRGNTGNNYSEGYKHGQCAAQFPNGFVLNTEWGWGGFWTDPTDPDAWNQFAGGFWDAIRDAGMSQRLGGSAARVGATFVVNVQPNGTLGAMMNASTVEFDRAVLDSVGYLTLETYGPVGGFSLDPANDIPWTQKYVHQQQGFKGMRIVGIMEPRGGNDLVAQIQQWDTTTKYGGQVWTLFEANSYFGTGLAERVRSEEKVEHPIFDPERLLTTTGGNDVSRSSRSTAQKGGDSQ
jgi:hypothetical protein